PLAGQHAKVACVACHKRPATEVKPKSDTCGSCHVDVHRGAFKQDCRACHSEQGFAAARFDHGTTAFPLTDKHLEVACRACHKSIVTAGLPVAKRVVTFQGLSKACANCHGDVHKGELGPSCQTCHTPKGFRLATFSHPRSPEFFSGQHALVACTGCHT